MSVLSAHAKMQAKAQKTQQDFLKKRIKTLNNASQLDSAKLKQCIDNLYSDHCGGRLGEDGWVDVYKKICSRLQESELTINFKCSSWFSSSNNYSTYSQMYERAIDSTTGKVRMTDDSINPADLRAVVDDEVTLPGKWAKKSVFSDKRKIYDKMSFSNNAAPTTSEESVKKQFGTGGKSTLVKVAQEGEGRGAINTYETTNAKFNPFAKQVFTALNYGQRPHGSSTFYGMSYITLRPQLKESSLYFGQDTFTALKKSEKEYLARTKRDRAGTAATFDGLAHVLAWTNFDMQEHIFLSCYLGQSLPDTASAMHLLEAHIFSDIRMDRDVEEVVLSREPNMTADWDIIQTHCYNWARRNNIRVYINHG